jgi:glutathione S-transferase
MKLYVKKLAPNARRVMMFIAEKELDMTIVEVSDSKGESQSEDFLAKNPLGQVPVLELASGVCLSESMAICRMLDEQFPELSLFGVGLEERAIVHMWSRRVENLLFIPAVEYGHHSQDMLADQFDQIPAFAELCRATIERAYALLEFQLDVGPYVAGDRFSVADIVAFCGLELARVWGVPPAPSCEALCRWHDEVSQRPSAEGIAYITTGLR